MPGKELSKQIIRKNITKAKLQVYLMLHQLPVEEWTDADTDILYSITHDADILEKIPSLVGGV